jgi:hypothetical protein
MAIFNLYSKRQKKLRGEVPEVFSFNELPQRLKVQIIQIIQDSFGVDKGLYGYPSRSQEAYKFIHDTLCREYGVFTLSKVHRESDEESILNHLLQINDIESEIDVIELCFKYLTEVIDKDYNTYTFLTNVKITPDEAVLELNSRFKEHGIGYQFESGEIIRIDSTYIHSEITKPVLILLSNKKFIGANEEYLKAHEHYRHGRNKECLIECLKSLESTIKIICKMKGWNFNETDTAKKLIQICFQNGLIPTFTQNQFTSLQSLIESGIPTLRNRLGGHGQGHTPQKVDDDITRYCLNLTGTNIIFLIEQSRI